MKSKTKQSGLGCRSAHVCSCFPRTARFSVVPREQFGELGRLPTFLWRSLVFSDSYSGPTHNTANLPVADSSVKPEAAETLPQSASGLHDNGQKLNPAYSVKPSL